MLWWDRDIHMSVLSRFSPVQLFATPWTIACQAPLSVGFSKQVYLSGLAFPPPGDLPDPRIKPKSPALAGRFFTTEPPGNPHRHTSFPLSNIIMPYQRLYPAPDFSRWKTGS